MTHNTGAEALRHALESETRFVDELRAALAAQRDAVSRNEPAAVEASTHGIAQILHALDETRRHRVSIEEMAGPETRDDQVAVARATLRSAAAVAARDLAINRAVLRGALDHGDAFLQLLFGAAPGGAPAYGPDRGTASRGADAVLLNQVG